MQCSISPATTEGRVAAPPYVPVQVAEVGSVIQAVRVVQVAPSHFPKMIDAWNYLLDIHGMYMLLAKASTLYPKSHSISKAY